MSPSSSVGGTIFHIKCVLFKDSNPAMSMVNTEKRDLSCVTTATSRLAKSETPQLRCRHCSSRSDCATSADSSPIRISRDEFGPIRISRDESLKFGPIRISRDESLKFGPIRISRDESLKFGPIRISRDESTKFSQVRISRDESSKFGPSKKSTCCRYAPHLGRSRRTASGGRKHSCGLPENSCVIKRSHCTTSRRWLRMLAFHCCASLCAEHSQEPDDKMFIWSPHYEHLRCSLSLLLRGPRLRNIKSPASLSRSLEETETLKPQQPCEVSDCTVSRVPVPSRLAFVAPDVQELESCASDALRRDSSHSEEVYAEHNLSHNRNDRIPHAASFRDETQSPRTPECIYSPIVDLNSKESECQNSRYAEHKNRHSGSSTRSCNRDSINPGCLSKNNTENESSICKQRTIPRVPSTPLPSTNSSDFPRGNNTSCVALRRPFFPSGKFRWSSAWTVFFPLMFLLCASLPNVAEGCSSRSTPRPRPQNTTLRPNITFQTYACPPAYAAWYCLNGATCFTVKISESILYNCECADGYMGQRCEYKDLDGSYLPAGGKVLLETASIAGGAALIILLVFFGIFSIFVLKNKEHERELDGVPRINININNSWPGPPGGNAPTRFCEHHTITTSTPPHHEISPQSPHNEHQPHSLNHSSTHSTLPFSSHSLVSVSGKTLSSDAEGGKDWGQPDRIVKTVTTITDLASIYSGRKQAIHRVEVVQEVDEVSGDKVPLSAHFYSCPGTTPWGNSGPLLKSPWTTASPWSPFKVPPLLTSNQTADDQVKILPSKDSKLCDSQKLPALVSPRGDANNLSTSQFNEDVMDSESVPDISCQKLPENRPDILPASPLYRAESPSLSPPASVHFNRSNVSSLDNDFNSNLSEKPVFTQISCPSYNSTSSPSYNSTFNPSVNRPSSPRFNPIPSPNFNSTTSSSFNVNAGTHNSAFTFDEV